MKLRTKFEIISVVVIGLILIVGLFVFIQVQELERQIEENRAASEIMKGVFELNLLTSDYLLHPGERNQEQWQSRHQSIEKLFELDIFDDLEEQTILDNLRQDHEVIQTTFLKLTENLESQEISPKLEERLVAELLVKSQAMLSGASRLMEVSRAELANTQQKTALFIMISVAILAGILLLVLLVLVRSILGPVLVLQKGAEIIGSGNLKHRIDIKRKDEIGILAQAFNKMVENLAKEITEHERTEGILQERMKELSVIYETSKIMEGSPNLDEALSKVVKIIPSAYRFPKLACAKIVYNGKEYKTANFKETKWKQAAIIKIAGKRTGIVEVFYLEEKPFLVEEEKMIKEVTSQIGSISGRKKTEEAILKAEVEKARAKEAEAVAEELKRVDKMKDEFLDIASHELRTPLTAIRGNISLMQEHFPEKLKDGKLNEIISDVHESSVRLIGLVNDFLDVSRLEGGRIEFEKEKFVLSKLIQEVIDELESSASEKGLYLRLEKVRGHLPNVLADKERTRQIITNLFGNAIKYTKKGGVTIKIERGDGLVKAKVVDTGIGIPKENQKLLFQKFQQAGERVLARDVSRGTGLGLYISKMLVEGMGGKIYLVRTELRKGSTFGFELPIADKKRETKS